MLEKDFKKNKKTLDTLLCVDKSFDVVRRDLIICDKNFCIYFIDGLIKDETMLKIIDSLIKIKSLDTCAVKCASSFFNTYIPYVEVEEKTDEKAVVSLVLSGAAALIGEELSGAIVIDARTYPVRSITEPENDKVLRGARVGFVETLVFNTALIRRHIRDPRLRMEIKSVGEVSKTDVVICYLDGVADEKYVKNLSLQIDNIKTDSLSLGAQSLAECLIKKRWYNPFPKTRYTERPDTAAASLIEGSVIIITDNSPSAMILPTAIFDFIQETDDYYLPPLTGTYLRIVRGSLFFLTMILSPLWYLLITHPSFIPSWLEFITIKEPVGVPIIIQLFLLEFAVDGMKLAALNTPSVLAGSFSIIGGLLLGDFAVKVGWFIPQTILYSAFVAISNFAQPSYELGYAFKFMRMILLLLTALFGLWGFISGFVLVIVLIVSNKTVDGSRSYLYPLIPFNAKALLRLSARVRKK